MGAVYVITNRLNGRQYVGLTTKEPSERFREHVQAASRGGKYPLHRALRKYGTSNFDVEVLHQAEGFARPAELEIQEIRRLETRSRGYNLTAGGEGFKGYVPTEEVRKRTGDAIRKAWAERRLKGTATVGTPSLATRKLQSEVLKAAWERKKSSGNLPDFKARARSRKSNRFVDYQNRSVTLTELSEKTGINRCTLADRLGKGMSVEEAVGTPVKNQPRILVVNGEEIPFIVVTRRFGISKNLLARRLQLGWDDTRAATFPVNRNKGPKRVKPNGK